MNDTFVKNMTADEYLKYAANGKVRQVIEDLQREHEQFEDLYQQVSGIVQQIEGLTELVGVDSELHNKYVEVAEHLENRATIKVTREPDQQVFEKIQETNQQLAGHIESLQELTSKLKSLLFF